MKIYRFILSAFLFLHFSIAHAQLNAALPLDTFQINTIDQFSGANKSWSIGGTVMMNRTSSNIKLSPGKGILVFERDKDKSGNNITAFTHGNMDFEIEFMLAPQSEAAILFQGMYVIHLKDNWGQNNLTYKDCGGISVSESMSSGEVKNVRRIPAFNACHAPGLWQKLQVSFAAPLFDAQGEKIKNARFDRVILNGAIIHENVELPVAGVQEKATGPLVIAGIKGPVAFKSMAHLPVNNDRITLKNVTYKYMDGKMNDFPDFATGKIIKTGNLNAISWQPNTSNEDFAFEYSGLMDVPATNQYNFQMTTLGGGRLIIDGKKIMEHASGIDHEGKMDRKDIATSTITLEKGLHPFSFTYYKNTWATVPVLGLFAQGRGNYSQALHDDNSFPPEDAVGRIIIKPGEETVMQRSFLFFKGKKKMHCISVGDPLGVNYSYDLGNGSLFQVWKGAFGDATGMWHVRGNQILEALGSPVLFNDNPQFAIAEQNAPWPDSLPKQTGYYRLKGYDLSSAGRPVFKYNIAGVNVADAIYPEENGRIITRKLNVNSSGAAGDVLFRTIKAKKIDGLSNGEYYINDGEYFIRFNTSLQVVVRQTKEGAELIIPLKKGIETEINYSIIW